MGNCALCGTKKTSKDLYKVENIRFKSAGQGHVFEHWSTLTPEQQDTLLDELGSFDPKQMNKLYDTLVKKNELDMQNSLRRSNVVLEDLIERIDPAFTQSVPDLLENDPDQFKEIFDLGLSKIKEGKVACVVLAGGQGSRLGFNHPKGMYNIGLPSQKSIFQILTEKFMKAQMLAHGSDSLTKEVQKCKLLIMTSKDNHEETVQFFKENSYFGAHPSSFIFFQQAVLPAIDKEGKILMKTPYEISLAPNGNGALFEAVNSNYVVKNQISKVDFVQVIGVDNVLNKLLDPFQVGSCVKNDLDACLKCAEKRDAAEKVGVVCKKNGKIDIVEYTELSDELMNQTNEDGSLYLQLGSLLMFMLSSKMLLKLCKDTTELNKLYHKAYKKLPCWDRDAQATVKPEEENGYKFELFLQSFLTFVPEDKFLALTVDRSEEFAPVKNANAPDGEDEMKDSPDQARRLVMELHKKWTLEKMEAGENDTEWLNELGVEVDVLLSYNGEGEKFETICQSFQHSEDDHDDLYIQN